ncbi:hypothetical protein AMTR_s00051p00220980 [Amborella trichopoda]|uniref:Sugar phosphate transporter domain-containing protein n=1 Tax=Amborella trichopoda TaxID=13333 RepID=U5D383_AMBTC|nr:hypothetical protein AMTR_s00051p00220980 [Amborella trichopoda]
MVDDPYQGLNGLVTQIPPWKATLDRQSEEPFGLVIWATSATTHVVLGQFKTCIILLGGSLLFQSDPGVMSICGAVGALCGMSVYTYLNLQKTTDAMTEAESV